MKIFEEIAYLVDPVFKELKGETFRLTKLTSSRPNLFVSNGDHSTGTLSFVPVKESYGVRVVGQGFSDYIRTSPVVKLIDGTDSSVRFQTEGGTYLLEVVE